MESRFRMDQFLRVSKDFTLPDGTVLDIRVLSDIDLEAVQTESIGASVNIAKELRDPESELYRQRITSLDTATRDTWENMLLTANAARYAREARETFPVDFFDYPENATLMQKVDTEEDQVQGELTVFQARQSYLEGRAVALRKKIAEWDDETLLRNARGMAVELYVNEEARLQEIYVRLYYACIVHETQEKYFTDVDHVRLFTDWVLSKLDAEYKEVSDIDPWSLTKSESEGEAIWLGPQLEKRGVDGLKAGEVAVDVDAGPETGK